MTFQPRRTVYCVCCAVCLLGASTSASADYTFEQIVDASRKRESTFHSQRSVYVEFLSDRYSPIWDNGWREKYVSARKDGMYYLRFEQLTPRKQDKGLSHPYWITWRDGVCVRRQAKAFTISAEPDFDLFDFNLYFRALFLNFWKDITVPSTILTTMYNVKTTEEAFAFHNLVAALSNPARKWQVVNELEKIDGAPCVVLKDRDVDTIWLDPKLGFACRQRQIAFWNGDPGLHYRMTEFKESVDGLWLPMKVVVTAYGHPDSSDREERGKVRRIETLTVQKISFAGIRDSLFDIPIPDHAFVEDQIRGMEYAVLPRDTADEDLIKRTLVNAQRELPAQPGPKWYSWLSLSLLFTAGLVVGVFVRRIGRH